MRIEDTCMACGQCQEYCPNGAIKIEDSNGYGQCYIDLEICTDCGACLDADCPAEAITKGEDKNGI